ncbi:MAG: suppressor of fused domain protein [Acidobacteria bacterium]|nr:suppressor of fused domain protein [Acidobacteriota bacterium]
MIQKHNIQLRCISKTPKHNSRVKVICIKTRKDIESHYRHFLGAPRYVNKLTFFNGSPFEIMEYWDTSCTDAVVLVTVGLSDFSEESIADPRLTLNQELVFICYENFYSQELVKLLGSIARETKASGSPLSKGNILGPAGPILTTTTMEAFYISIPFYLEQGFHRLQDGCIEIEFIWLVPIYRAEAEGITNHNTDEFEALLENQDPNLLDLSRPLVILVPSNSSSGEKKNISTTNYSSSK